MTSATMHASRRFSLAIDMLIEAQLSKLFYLLSYCNGFLVRHHVHDPTHQFGTHSIEFHPCVNETGPLSRYISLANAVFSEHTTTFRLSTAIV
jgi:hypothetical protein